MAKYFIYKNGQQEGPYEPQAVIGMKLSPDTFVWCEGMTDWKPISQVPELQQPQPAAPPQFGSQGMPQDPPLYQQAYQQPQQQQYQQQGGYQQQGFYQQQTGYQQRPVNAYNSPNSYNDIGIWDYYVGCLKNYTGFEGRARRKEYWSFVLVNFLISFGISFLGGFFAYASKSLEILLIFNIISWIYSLAVFIPGLAVISRRLHDTGRGFGWFFIIFTIIGAVVLLVFMFLDSDYGDNRFGPNPKGMG